MNTALKTKSVGCVPVYYIPAKIRATLLHENTREAFGSSEQALLEYVVSNLHNLLSGCGVLLNTYLETGPVNLADRTVEILIPSATSLFKPREIKEVDWNKVCEEIQKYLATDVRFELVLENT